MIDRHGGHNLLFVITLYTSEGRVGADEVADGLFVAQFADYHQLYFSFQELKSAVALGIVRPFAAITGLLAHGKDFPQSNAD